MRKKINSILIANRGEIASRIIRSCQNMGIISVAVYSDTDREAPFVQQADKACYLGGNVPSASYLNQGVLLKIAAQEEVDAIHPGYGFLSENSVFAQKCVEANILFIGPHPGAIAAMASKANAKKLMERHQVPIIPGYQEDDQSLDRLMLEAKKIGFPLLLKAVAGGGGKGMRIVNNPSELKNAIDSAKRESSNAFGNDALIIEKYIPSGRHIEFQIFGDSHGNVIHLFERECTLQRRYQKVLEESPSPILSEALRKEMGKAAVRAAKAIQYDNAGTVEFIYDNKDESFYFLEVNTRLQVEHPVTEEITGLDLVELQINVAQGQKLPYTQEEIKRKGYAVEVRLYAEDPNNDYAPDIGTIQKFKTPKINGLRIESAIVSGSEISMYYDPMIAKVIVHDTTREQALRKLHYALSKMICLGVQTNLSFLRKLVAHQQVIKGIYDINFLSDHLKELQDHRTGDQVHLSAIAASIGRWSQNNEKRRLLKHVPSGWRNNFYSPQKYTFEFNLDDQLVCLYRYTPQGFDFQVNDKKYTVRIIRFQNNSLSLEINGTQLHFALDQFEQSIYVDSLTEGWVNLRLQDRLPVAEIKKEPGSYQAPMPAQIIDVLVREGDVVAENQALLVFTSMKMENTLLADAAGIVSEVFVAAKDQVSAGAQLLQIEPK